MRQPQPFWKTSHKCWYVKINGKMKRLDPDETKAWRKYHKLMAGTRLVGEEDRVIEVVDQFLDWSNLNHEPTTFRYYLRYNRSFCGSIPRTLKLRDLRPIHVTKWVDSKWPPQEVCDGRGKVITPSFLKLSFRAYSTPTPVGPCSLWPENARKSTSML